jgi:hypothetical protein
MDRAAHGTPKQEVAHEDWAHRREASAMWLDETVKHVFAWA